MNELGNTPADKDYKPSGISRAEERAQAYENGLDYYHYTGDNPSVAYKAGYEQAEKDLVLTWKDIQTIDNIVVDMARNTDWPLRGQEVFYTEVLRRFHESKEKK